MFHFNLDLDFEFHLDLEHFQADFQALAPSAMPQNQKRKRVLLNILINLGVVSYLIGFIFLYTAIFGMRNSVGGISIATSLLMFTHLDMGIKNSHAPVLIILMFLFSAFSSHVGVWDPFWGIAVNFISIFLIVTFACQNINSKVYLPFVVCYIFNQGNPVEGHELYLRVIGLFTGAVMVSIVYLIFNRKKRYPFGILSIFKSFRFSSQRTRFAFRLASALAMGMFIGDIFHLPRTAWIGMTINSLILPFIHETKARFPLRILAQFGGAILVYLVFGMLLPSQLYIVGIFFTSFLYMFFQNYFFQQLFVSINAMVGALSIAEVGDVLIMRWEFVLIGAAIVLVVNGIAMYGRPIDRVIQFRKKRRLGHAVQRNPYIPSHAH